MNKRRLPMWSLSVLAAGILLAAQFVLLVVFPAHGALTTSVISLLVSGLSAVAVLYASVVLAQRSKRLALAWRVLGLAQLCIFGGDLLWMVYEQVFGIFPSPSLADVFYLACYPLFLMGVMLMPAHEDTMVDWVKKAIDLLITFLAGGLVIWNYLVGPLLLAGAESDLLMMINLAYPLGDLLLIMAVLTILYRRSGLAHASPQWVLAAALGALIFFDMFYLYQSMASAYTSGSFIDLSYTLGNALVGLAGIRMAGYAQQTQIRLELPPEEDQQIDRNWLSYLPYGWVAGAYVLLVLRDITVMPMERQEIYLFVGLMIAMVIVRQLIVLWENRTLAGNLRFALEQVRNQSLTLEKTNREMQVEIQERRRAEERLTYDALHDALTGLPNRALFIDRLGQAGRKKKRSLEYQYAVLFLDVDSFKVVNDSLGHIAGDMLLMRTGKILEKCVRGSDTVARLGGDEFVILLDDIHQIDDSVNTAERLLSELSHPIQLDGTRVFISVSIGIVQQVEEYENAEDVLRDADLAMYQAKSRGKARYEIFHADMRANIILRLAIENDLRRALEFHEFVLHYQPILELPNRRLVGFEALVRWNHPTRGLVPPAEFIPVTEETGLILPLGKWILYEACRQCREWQDSYPDEPLMKVSVNISGTQLKQPDFVQMVARALQDTNLDAERLTLEVTESVCLDNLDHIARTLEALKVLGVETQIDDFGTGYSSLSYLQRLPVGSIKIDRSFIQSISQPEFVEERAAEENTSGAVDSDGKAEIVIELGGRLPRSSSTPDIVRAIFSMVNDLGIKAIAEGIETEVQLAELTRLKCAYVQGFLLAMPMEQAKIGRWLAGRAANG